MTTLRVQARESKSQGNPIAVPRRVVVAGIFALIYTLIPWPQIWLNATGTPMWDREVYIRQITSGDLIYDHTEYIQLWDFISNEYLWGWTLRRLYSAGIAPEAIFDSIGFLFIFLASLIVLSRLPVAFLLFLVNPLVIGLAFSQSRIALMICVMYLAYFAAKRWRVLSLILIGLTPLLHTSAPLFLVLYFVSNANIKKNPLTRTPFLPILAGIMVSALSGPLMSSVLTVIDDRRAGEYQDMSSGPLFLLMWALGMIYLLRIWPRIRTDSFCNMGLAIMALATSSLVFDSYASRFLAVLFPISLVALSHNYTLKRRVDFILILFSIYIILLWVDFFY